MKFSRSVRRRLKQAALTLLPMVLMMGTVHSTVTEQLLQDAILGAENFTPEQLQQMDLNSDGLLDVADMVTLASSLIVEFSSVESVINESSGTHIVEVTVNRPVSNKTIRYAVGGTASLGSDFADPSGGAVTIVNGTSVQIPLVVSADDLYEGYEFVELSLLPDPDYFLGDVRTHQVLLEENSQGTQADYLFILSRELPHGAAHAGSDLGLFNKTVSISLTFTGSDVSAAHINEDKSIGISDDDPSSTVIHAHSIEYQDNGLELSFRYATASAGLFASASLASFNFTLESDFSPPPLDADDAIKTTNTLTIIIQDFDVATEKFTAKLLEGVFRLTVEGLLSPQTDNEPDGVVIGSMQPLGVSR